MFKYALSAYMTIRGGFVGFSPDSASPVRVIVCAGLVVPKTLSQIMLRFIGVLDLRLGAAC